MLGGEEVCVCVLEVPVYLYLPVDNEIVKIILIHLING